MPDRPDAGYSADFVAPRSWGLISLLCLLASAIAPPVYFWLGAHVAPRIILAGVLTWAVAIAAKHPLALLLNRIFGQSGHPGLLAGLQGLLSAVLELAAAGSWLYAFPDEVTGIEQILAFGSAAGSAEVVYVLAAGIRSRRDPATLAAWERSAVTSLCVRYSVPLERAFALVGHTGSRGMVYVGLQMLPGIGGLGFLLAVLALFSAVDGVAYYGHLRRWNWFDPGVCRRSHTFFSAVSVLEVVIFFAGFTTLQ